MFRPFNPQQFEKLHDQGSAAAAAAKATEILGVDSRTAEAMAWDTARVIQRDRPLDELDGDERENRKFSLDLAVALEARMRAEVEKRNAEFRAAGGSRREAGAPALVGLSS